MRHTPHWLQQAQSRATSGTGELVPSFKALPQAGQRGDSSETMKGAGKNGRLIVANSERGEVK